MNSSAGIELPSSAELAGAAVSILAAPDLESSVLAALQSARQLTGARYAACGVVDPATGGFDRYITVGLDESTVRAIGDAPKGHGVLGLVLRRTEPLALADIRTHPESYGFPVNHPVMTSFVGVGLWVGGAVWGSFCVTDKAEGGDFTAEDKTIVGEIARMTAQTANLHLRTHTAEARAADLARDRDAYTASNDLARSLAGQPDLDHMMELIVKRGRALTGARSAVLALSGVDGLVVEAVAGMIDRSLLGSTLPVSSDEREVLRSSGSAIAERNGRFAPVAQYLNGSTAMIVPLVLRTNLVGVLLCVDRADLGSGFSAHDLAIAEAFGTSAAVAIATARSAQEQALQRAIAASERERAHWARELHDETLQDLAAIKLLLGMAQRAASEETRTELLEKATEQIDTAAVDLRRLVAELRPAALDAYGLAAAIEGLVGRVGAMGDQTITFHCSLVGGGEVEGLRLDPQVEGVVYRVIQEALNNVARHSGARHARVECVVGDGTLRATVVDDGVGFDPGAQDGGFGLIGMRERADLIGGDLRVESRPNAGTTVSLIAHIDSEVGHV
jgi:signal transduction histidine kinase